MGLGQGISYTIMWPVPGAVRQPHSDDGKVRPCDDSTGVKEFGKTTVLQERKPNETTKPGRR